MNTVIALLGSVTLATISLSPVQAADLKPVPPAASAPAATAPPAAAAPASPPARPAAATTPAAAPAGTVARAQFTQAVENREPVDKVSKLLNDKQQIYFFSEIKDMSNHQVTHRWEHGGKVMSEVKFDIGGDRWRVYSNKTLDPNLTGEWKVTVVDENGSTLGSNSFIYEQATAAAAQPATAQPAATTGEAAPAAAR